LPVCSCNQNVVRKCLEYRLLVECYRHVETTVLRRYPVQVTANWPGLEPGVRRAAYCTASRHKPVKPSYFKTRCTRAFPWRRRRKVCVTQKLLEISEECILGNKVCGFSVERSNNIASLFVWISVCVCRYIAGSVCTELQAICTTPSRPRRLMTSECRTTEICTVSILNFCCYLQENISVTKIGLVYVILQNSVPKGSFV
jgi:hypothetical protein